MSARMAVGAALEPARAARRGEEMTSTKTPRETFDANVARLIAREFETGGPTLYADREWVSNGRWLAAWSGPPPVGAMPIGAESIEAIAGWLATAPIPLVEIAALRVLSKYHVVDVGCDGCECGACRGTVKEERHRERGQVVLAAESEPAGEIVVLDDLYAELFEGLEIGRLGPMGHPASPVGGFLDGALVAVVMGVRETRAGAEARAARGGDE